MSLMLYGGIVCLLVAGVTCRATLNGDGDDEPEIDPPVLDRHRRSMLDVDQPEVPDGGVENVHLRSRRSIRTPTDYQWDSVIPYEIDTDVSQEEKNNILFNMKVWEHVIHLRFVERDPTANETYLYFFDSSGLFSGIGNERKAINLQSFGTNEQRISCGTGAGCIHELGHVVGLNHEQTSPLYEEYLNVHYDKIDPTALSNFKMKYPEEFSTFGYFDYFSPMLYSPTTFTVQNPLKTYDLRDSQFNYVSIGNRKYELYYPAYEVATIYGLADNICSAIKDTCGVGYEAMIDGTCQCRCPLGLGNSDCASIEPTYSDDSEWPAGSYGLLKTSTGCPSGFTGDGSVWHKGSGNVAVSDYFHASGTQSGKEITHEFCVRDNSAGSGSWGPGTYCILKGSDDCHSDFTPAYCLFDDNTQSSSGTLPDMDVSPDVEMRFCCRRDASPERELELPTTKPFILFQASPSNKCQKVKGMDARSEWFKFKNMLNIGTFSDILDLSRSFKFYTINFCHYTPRDQSCGAVIDLTAASPTQTITYPASGSYPLNTRCSWIVKSPADTTIKLNFASFDVNVGGGAECEDSLEIRHGLPGNPGEHLCGTSVDRTFVSEFNIMSFHLHSGPENAASGFQATISLVDPSDLCYTERARDGSYSGTRNFTRNYETCLPWHEMTHCNNHPFFTAGGDELSNLKENYCRNPGVGARPWCYTSREFCITDYCDVCNIDECRDMYDDCQNSGTFCTDDPDDDGQRCANTCDRCPAAPTTTACSAPSSVENAAMTGGKESYSLGDKVTFTCNSNPTEQQTQTCSSDGQWVPAISFVCGACPDGFVSSKKHCFKFVEKFLKGNEGLTMCSGTGGELADIDDATTGNDVKEAILAIMPLTKHRSNLPYVWVKQAPGSNKCQRLNKDGTSENNLGCGWYYRHPTFCHYAPTDRTTCTDQNEAECLQTLELTPTICDYEEFAWSRCPKTCGQCSDADPMSPSTSTCNGVAVGAYTTETCPTGQTLTSGNLVRACKPDGSFSGSDKVCTDSTTVPAWTSNLEMLEREKQFGNRKSYFAMNKYHQIHADGYLTKFRYHVKYDGQLHLQVWRQIGTTSFQLVAQAHVSTVKGGRSDTYVVASPGLAVQQGDYIGFLCDDAKTVPGGISYTNCLDSDAGHVMKSSSRSKVVGNMYTFAEQSIACAHFSLDAYVEP